jgi:hypothetical protein
MGRGGDVSQGDLVGCLLKAAGPDARIQTLDQLIAPATGGCHGSGPHQRAGDGGAGETLKPKPYTLHPTP